MQDDDKTIRMKRGGWLRAKKMCLDSRETLGEFLERLVDAEWERVKILEANAAQWQAVQP
jgi:hypothetical protein